MTPAVEDPWVLADSRLTIVTSRAVMYCNAAWGSEELKLIGSAAFTRYRALLGSYRKLMEDRDVYVPPWTERADFPDLVEAYWSEWGWDVLDMDLGHLETDVDGLLASYRDLGTFSTRNARKTLNRVLFVFLNEYATLMDLWERSGLEPRFHTHVDLVGR